MEYLWAILFVLTVLGGWLLNLVSLPGNWVIVLAAAAYTGLVPTDGRLDTDWPIVIALLVLAGLGELIELAASAAGVARLGGSRRGAMLTLVGSIVGAVVGAIVGVPVPIVGPLIAALFFGSMGALVGALWGEHRPGRPWGETWQFGKAAFWGRLFGTLGKILVGSVMVAVALLALLF